MSDEQPGQKTELSDEAKRAVRMWECMIGIVRNTPMGRLRAMEEALGASVSDMSFDDLRARMWVYHLAHPEMSLDAIEELTLSQVEDGIMAWEDGASTPSSAPEASGTPGSAVSTASTPGTSGA